MRLLVHGRSVAFASRIGRAAAGLAGRGHEVLWVGDRQSGDGGPGGPHAVARIPAGVRVDLVIGAGAPFGPVRAGWWAGAHGLILDPGLAEPAWNFLDRLAWSSLDSIAIRAAAGPPADPGADPISPGRATAWPDVPAAAEPDPAHPDVESLERACERLHARRRGFAARPAVFLDRDGTLVVEREYLSNPEQIELLPGTAEALRALRAAGYSLVVISNQSGVGRGLFSLATVHRAMARLRRELRIRGVELDAIHFCPHRPDEGCACRKPAGELIRRAADDLRLSLRESAMVGDKLLDVETGQRAGMAGVLVRTGYGRDEEIAGGSHPPDHVAEDLAAATPWLIERRRG